MNDLTIKTPTQMENKTTVSFRVEKNGKTCNYNIEQIENGYLVIVNEYGYEGKEGDKNRKYIDITKKTYFKENPLDSIKKKESKEDKSEDIFEALSSALGLMKKSK